MAPPAGAGLLAIAALVLLAVAADAKGLKVGFYNVTCPAAESLVQQAVAAAFANNSGIAPGLIRMHFHDCFVRGCDGSVLIDSTANNTAEKDSPPNNPSLRGFEVIDAAKAAVEQACPNTVSCADILAFAARDSVALAAAAAAGASASYQVPSGRRDGTVSIANDALNNLPAPTDNITDLITAFRIKNLTAEDMAVLSGAHTVGISHCGAFLNRIYNFSSNSSTDPSLSSAYAKLLQAICPADVSNTPAINTTTTAMDIFTPEKLDNKYYLGIKEGVALFTSDMELLKDANLSALVTKFVQRQDIWLGRFKKAMVKMGKIEVLTGTAGQIRINCRVVNSGVTYVDDVVTGADEDEGDNIAFM